MQSPVTSDKKKAIAFSVAIYGILLLILFFIRFWPPYNPDSFTALAGGGGGCTFDNGLGSFEKIVSETAMGAIGLARAVDHVANTILVPGYPQDPTKFKPMFTSDKAFGSRAISSIRQAAPQ
jgi:hypothetical protein